MAAAAEGSDSGSVSEYMKKLLEKAEDYCNGSFDTVTHLYRNKPESYFDNIRTGDNVMMKALKDGGGDPKSPINNCLSGVFFSVTLRHGSPPTRSPFGDTRVHVPIEAIFDDSTNLYFTDFHCFKKHVHYITVVLTKEGSDADDFCRERLPRLDPANNKFLTKSDGHHPEYRTASHGRLHLEVVYTEDVDISDLEQRYGTEVFFSKTDIIGKGTSVAGGIPKNCSCKKCNISVSRPTRHYDDDDVTGYDVFLHEQEMNNDAYNQYFGHDYDYFADFL